MQDDERATTPDTDLNRLRDLLAGLGYVNTEGSPAWHANQASGGEDERRLRKAIGEAMTELRFS